MIPYHQKYLQTDDISPSIFIVSAPGSGKSYMIFNKILPNLVEKKNKDVHIFIFSETLQSSDRNQQYLNILNEYVNVHIFDTIEPRSSILEIIQETLSEGVVDTNFLYQQYNNTGKAKIYKHGVSEIQYFYTPQSAANQPKIIVIFDDIVDNENLKKIKQILTLKRHHNMIVIISVQSINMVQKYLRNLFEIMLIKDLQRGHLENIYENTVSSHISQKEFYDIYDTIMKQDRSFLMINQFKKLDNGLLNTL